MPKPSQNARTGANTDDRHRLGGDQQWIGGAAQRRREVNRDRQHRSDGGRDQDPEQHLLRGDQEAAPQQRAVGVERLRDLVGRGKDQREGRPLQVDVELPDADQREEQEGRGQGLQDPFHVVDPQRRQGPLAQLNHGGIGAFARSGQR